MISASTLNSELINKIAQDFAQATSLAVVVVNIHGDEISELFNFTPFCQLMRQHPEHSGRCRMSDRCGGLEASKNDQLCIYRCHAGLTDFSIPLVIAGHLVGFVLCGQVRLSNDVELVDILNVDDRWQNDPALVQAFRNVPEMDYSRVIASADLLKLIVENCLKKQLNFVVIKDNPSQNDPAQSNRAPSPHDGKMKKALRYIDAHLSDELRLEDVAAHVYLREVAIKWSAAPDMTPQTVLYRRPVAQFSNFQPKIVSSWLILALFQANFLISGRSRLCPYQLVNSNQVRQGE